MAQEHGPDELTQRFAASVMDQDEAIMRGDARRGNRHAKEYIGCAQRLLALGDDGADKLAALLAHPEPSVRGMAAAFLLKRRTKEALAVLRVLARGRGLVAFEAQECIKRWEEGNWHLE